MARKPRGAESAPVPTGASLPPAVPAALWWTLFLALALVPDQKILRWKLLALESGVLLLLLTTAWRWASERTASFTRTPLDLPILLYTAGGLLFYALSPERGVSRAELTRVLFCAASFFSASQTWPSLGGERGLLRAFGWSAGLVAAYAALQPFGGVGPLLIPELQRPIATFGNPIFLAAYLASALPALIALARAEESPAARAGAALCALLCLAALWAAQSRAAFAGLLAAGALAGLFALRGKARAAAFAGLAAAAALALWHFQGRQWTHGLIWKDALALWRAHPLLGCGLGRFHVEFPAFASAALRALWPEQKVIINFAHNEYLQVLAETGLTGLALFLVIPAAVLLWARRPGTAPLARAAALPAAAVLLAQALFSPDLRFGVSSFVLFALLGGACALDRGRPLPLPVFPGRLACAALLLLAAGAWGLLAAAPALAGRRLAREPGFYIERTPELRIAMAELEARVQAEPENGDLAEHLAWLHAKAQDWERAVPLYERAARLMPGRPGPLNNLGNIAYTVGRRDEAILWWERSLSVDSEQLDAHLNLGKTLYESGRLKEAAAHLQKVLARDPGNVKAQVLLKKMVE